MNKKMQKLHIVITLSLVIGVFIFAGCTKKVEDLRASLVNQAETTVRSVKDTASSVQTQVLETKKSIEQKVTDVNNAIKEVQEAASAVKKVTGE